MVSNCESKLDHSEYDYSKEVPTLVCTLSMTGMDENDLLYIFVSLPNKLVLQNTISISNERNFLSWSAMVPDW
jgi:hypothetical protein